MQGTMDTSALSQSQELIWLGEQLLPGFPINNMAFAFALGNKIEVDRLRKAFSELIAASDALRMVFVNQEGKVRPQVLEELEFVLPFRDESDNEDPVAYHESLRPFIEQTFDFERRLFDALLIKFSTNDYILYFNQHHLITDGWGMSVQVKWLLAAYAGNATPELSSFAEYLVRASKDRKSPKVLAGREAWIKKVAGYPDPPALFGRANASRSTEAQRLVVPLGGELLANLRDMGQRPEFRAWTPDLAMFNLLLTALFTLLYRLGGQEELVVGAPAHNRVTPSDKTTGGLFMELFPLYVKVTAEDTYLTLHEKVREASLEFLRYARPGTSSVATGRSFNVLFNYLNVTFIEEALEDFGVNWLYPNQTEPGHHFRLQVYDFEGAGQLSLCFDCNLEVFEGHQIAASNQYFEILRQLTSAPEQLVTTLHPRDQYLLKSFSNEADYPKDKTVVDLFLAQVQSNPTAPAVRFREFTLTYAELDQQTDVLARKLRAQGVRREAIVAVCLERSEKMLIALLGVLKAGAAYLPIDPDFPQERKEFLCADAGAKSVVTTVDSAFL
ncbi:MAG: condensation domain-containing protein, partial [Bacteroidota bacterium]